MPAPPLGSLPAILSTREYFIFFRCEIFIRYGFRFPGEAVLNGPLLKIPGTVPEHPFHFKSKAEGPGHLFASRRRCVGCCGITNGNGLVNGQSKVLPAISVDPRLVGIVCLALMGKNVVAHFLVNPETREYGGQGFLNGCTGQLLVQMSGIKRTSGRRFCCLVLVFF